MRAVVEPPSRGDFGMIWAGKPGTKTTYGFRQAIVFAGKRTLHTSEGIWLFRKVERLWITSGWLGSCGRWEYWIDLDRGTAVVMLREAGESQRELAKIAGCSEGLIRNIEVVGRLPYEWKQCLREGESTRKVVAAWRSQHRQS